MNLLHGHEPTSVVSLWSRLAGVSVNKGLPFFNPLLVPSSPHQYPTGHRTRLDLLQCHYEHPRFVLGARHGSIEGAI